MYISTAVHVCFIHSLDSEMGFAAISRSVVVYEELLQKFTTHIGVA